jgi:hypothetical protein
MSKKPKLLLQLKPRQQQKLRGWSWFREVSVDAPTPKLVRRTASSGLCCSPAVN